MIFDTSFHKRVLGDVLRLVKRFGWCSYSLGSGVHFKKFFGCALGCRRNLPYRPTPTPRAILANLRQERAEEVRAAEETPAVQNHEFSWKNHE